MGNETEKSRENDMEAGTVEEILRMQKGLGSRE